MELSVAAMLLGASQADVRAYSYYHSDAPPSTLTLDRMDSGTRAGLQVGVDRLHPVQGDEVQAMRFELYGQYDIPSRVFGLYGDLALSHLFASDATASSTAFSSLDVGGYFLPFRTSGLVLRVGLILPITHDSDFEPANVYTQYERLTDFLLTRSHPAWRLSVSTVQQSGLAFFRGDLGLDLWFDRSSAGTFDTFLRANLAAGVRLRPLDLSIELVNIAALNDYDNSLGPVTEQPSSGHHFTHTATVGLSTRGTDQFRIGLVFPLNDDLRGDVWILTLGYQHATN